MSDLAVIDLKPATSTMQAEVLAGLDRTHKSIAPKFLYDARGSDLFEAITDLPEYYLTRTERGILRRCAADIAAAVGPDHVLVEFGSGSSGKVRLLLDALRPAAYLPVDISRHALARAGQALRADYPWLRVVPVCADYSRPFALPALAAGSGRRTVFFPGSSIGNFEPRDAVNFLTHVAGVVGPAGQLLIGIDLKKDPAVLEPAYNDAQGVTADFNLNVLNHLNEAVDADFDLDGYAHRARYDAAHGRIEIHLVSQRAQTVTIGERRIALRAGEAIHTENSYKYDVPEFDGLARQAGFVQRQAWLDPKKWFAVILYEAGSATWD
jgi:dimethylhistidine N-methyltransferase